MEGKNKLIMQTSHVEHLHEEKVVLRSRWSVLRDMGKLRKEFEKNSKMQVGVDLLFLCVCLNLHESIDGTCRVADSNT